MGVPDAAARTKEGYHCVFPKEESNLVLSTAGVTTVDDTVSGRPHLTLITDAMGKSQQVSAFTTDAMATNNAEVNHLDTTKTGANSSSFLTFFVQSEAAHGNRFYPAAVSSIQQDGMGL